MTEQNASRPVETLEQLFADVTTPSAEPVLIAADEGGDHAPEPQRSKGENDHVE